MNNNWKNNDNRGGRGRRNGRGPRNNQRQNNCNNFSGRGEINFPKFADNDYINNESNDWNYDNYANNNFNSNRNIPGAGIFPWIRKHPVNPLIIPPIEQIYNEPFYEEYPNINKFDAQNLQQPVENSSLPKANDKDNSVSRSRNNSVSTTAKSDAGVAETPKTQTEANLNVKIKQEKDLSIKLKQERKSSSSSSSSSESSSSDEERETTKKPAVLKKEAKPPSSPLNIKLKPKANPVNSTPVKAAQKLKAVPEPSSSSSSSSDEEASAPPAAKVEKKAKSQQIAKKETKTSKKKISSEDDVVCIGKLENKIVLEDESEDDESIESEIEEAKTTIINKRTTKSVKKTAEKCMICGKKGHTSFQCQMICKNCSGPYHGYRTCPQPTNLNTMMQLYMEFCMQQLQNFNATTQLATNPSDSIPKPQVDSPFSSIGNNKTNKLKRKAKASETKAKTKKSKKRKVSVTKKKSSKIDSDDSSDENEDDSDSETSATESEEESSDSPVESLVSSKKKLKMKNKNASKAALNLSNLTTNPANLPLVLNGFPNITVGTPTKQNPNTSTNALNTLLLTQMFQNAIGSLKQ